MQIEQQHLDFKLNQLVWAKVVGYPWWPAMIRQIEPSSQKPYIVHFIGHNTQERLSSTGLQDFQTQKDGLLTRKSSKLVKAYESAMRILNQKSTFEQETQKIIKNSNGSKLKLTPEIDAPGRFVDLQASRFKSPKARNRARGRKWISGDLRYVPESPQSEFGKNGKTKIRSRSRHKLQKISQLSKRKRAGKRCVSSEKSDSTIMDSGRSDLDSVFSNDDKMDKGVDTKDLDLSNYLETLVKKLSVIRTGKHSFSKEVTYAELLRLVRNCEKLNLDFDLLIGSKLGKYLHLAYIILLEINDTSSIGYQRLLPRISKIRKICKERILSFFSTDRNKIQKNDKNDVKSGKSLNLRTTKEKINFLMLNYEKENVMDPEEKDIDKDSAVVSLVDEGERSSRRMMAEKAHSLMGDSELRKEKKKRRYKKEEHYLKKVWLSRTNSPCPSQQSSLNFSTDDSMSFIVNKNKRKNVFKSPFKKPNLKNIFIFNSARNSLKSDKSSQGSLTESFNSMVPRSTQINKDMTTNEIIKIKKESVVQQSNQMPGLRKRVCRKVYSILNKEFKKPKTLSKKLTLALEYRINIFYPYKKNEYIKTVKSLFKKLRRHDISIEDLIGVAQQPLDGFKNFLTVKGVIKN